MSSDNNLELVKAKVAYELCLKKLAGCTIKKNEKPKQKKKNNEYNEFVKKVSNQVQGSDRMEKIGRLLQKEKRKNEKKNSTNSEKVGTKKNQKKVTFEDEVKK